MSPNVAASVRARLLAKANGEEFERTLARYAAERWLYRLGESRARRLCILKGASLLTVWLQDPYRATRDIDLLASGDTEAIRRLIGEVCAVECLEDGATFDLEQLSLEPIRAEEAYAGVRALFWARLGTARMRVQVDIGFGHDVIPSPQEVEYPTMLNGLPRPHVRAYPREASIAEKFEAMVKLEWRNSRMKDFHDLYALSRAFAFDGALLHRAIVACFDRRGTPWTTERPIALTSAFYSDDSLQKRWKAYLRSGGVLAEPPNQFEEIGTQIIAFLGPVRDAIVAGKTFEHEWRPATHWTANASGIST